MLQNICFQGLSCEQRPTTDLHGDLFSLVLCIGQLVYHHLQLHHQWFTTTHNTTSEGRSSKNLDMKHVSSSRWMQDIAESLKFIKHQTILFVLWRPDSDFIQTSPADLMTYCSRSTNLCQKCGAFTVFALIGRWLSKISWRIMNWGEEITDIGTAPMMWVLFSGPLLNMRIIKLSNMWHTFKVNRPPQIAWRSPLLSWPLYSNPCTPSMYVIILSTGVFSVIWLTNRVFWVVTNKAFWIKNRVF